MKKLTPAFWKWFRLASLLCAAVLVTLLSSVKLFLASHPLVFSESLFSHNHCVDMASGALMGYAKENGGKYPIHTDGYGDALRLAVGPQMSYFLVFNGPGHDDQALLQAVTSGRDVPEELCGRVYIQGLSETNDSRIAILFDKLSSPGDHVHGFKRLSNPYQRDVVFVGAGKALIQDKDWPAFVRQQIELLVQAGFSRREAWRLYAETFSARYP